MEAQLPAIVAAIGESDPAARVPTCPDLTIDELAYHVGEFCALWTHVVCEGTGRPKTAFPSAPELGAGRAEWVELLGGNLVDELRHAEAGTRCWTWHEPDQTAGFIANRACHELAVHRVDLEVAARGSATPLPPEVAVDGIEEIFFLVAVGGVDGARGAAGGGQVLDLRPTDHDARWQVHLDPERVRVTAAIGDADLTLTGSASDLEMLLYQRPTAGKVVWDGDATVLSAFHGEFTFA